jgi:effector-binding domain-containing protein
MYVFAFGGEKPAVKGESKFWIVSMKFKGSLDQIGPNMKVFIDEFFKQGFTPKGPPISILHNIPGMVNDRELLWELGFIVKKGTKVKKPLSAHTIKFPETASLMHVGPYEKLDETYKQLVKFVEKKGYKTRPPVINRYIDNPEKVKDASIRRTEVMVAVIKNK